MKKVFKYSMVSPDAIFDVPRSAKILSVANQHEYAVIWMEVDITEPMESRHFYTVMTGGYVADNSNYIGTVLISAGDLVLHIYEQKKS